MRVQVRQMSFLYAQTRAEAIPRHILEVPQRNILCGTFSWLYYTRFLMALQHKMHILL